MRRLGWLAPALLLAAGETRPPVTAEAIRLGRIQAHMRDILTRIPDYTCLQQIERSRRAAKSRRFQLVDTIRLEVALVQGKEMFAWPGAGKFDDTEIGRIVGGTIGNGNFALHARAVFLSGSAAFEYEGEVAYAKGKAHRYRFSVPRIRSGYLLRSGPLEGVTGYKGWFEADTQTLDLIRLEVEADDIPEHLPIKAARDRMEYARVTIGERDFLLPKASELALTDAQGTESRNLTSFSGCRHYTGESVISFADPEPAPATAAPEPVVPVELPDGLGLTVAFDETIRFDKAAIGDQITGRVVENARWKGKTMVPRGAVVKARLLGFKRYYARVEFMRVAVALTAVDFPGAHADIDAKIEDIAGLPGWTRTAVDKQGIINISGSRLELPRGLRMVWRVRSDLGKESK
jgi:hypothetical protein